MIVSMLVPSLFWNLSPEATPAGPNASKSS
jgi:hypothetical protein